MIKYIESKEYENVFSLEELEKLTNWFNLIPLSENQGLDPQGSVNKQLDYDRPISLVHKIIRPKINQILGPDHIFSAGSYKELKVPYATHIDNAAYISLSNSEATGDKKYEAAILIPLIENEKFNTVVFDIDDQINLPMGGEMPNSWLGPENDLDLDDFDHVPEPARSQIKKLPVAFVAQWKLGNVIVWRRNQLHASTNFAKFGLTKKFIIVFTL